MKKAVKKPIVLVLCVALIMSLSIVAFASETSGYRNSPTMYANNDPNYWDRGPAYALKSSKSKPKGTDCCTYFRNYGTLSQAFASNSKRKIYVQLMEDDGIGRPDHIKTYIGKFSGRKVSSFSLKKTYTSGCIEGHSKLELYTNHQIKTCSGDPSNKTVSTGLYQYKITVN